jgi:hypothetical protein
MYNFDKASCRILQCLKEYYVSAVKETALSAVHRVEVTRVANCTSQDGWVADPARAGPTKLN